MADSKPEDKGDSPTADLSMDEILNEIRKRYSLIPKEQAQAPPTQPLTKLAQAMQGLTPKMATDSLFAMHKTSTPVTTAQFNMPAPTSQVHEQHADPHVTPAPYNMMDYMMHQPTQPSFNQPMTYHPSLPRIPTFSGDSPIPKGEVDYLVWRYEVQCLMNIEGLTCSQVLQIIRGSLRGSARMMIVPLGEQDSVENVLVKLDALYSNAASKKELMTEF